MKRTYKTQWLTFLYFVVFVILVALFIFFINKKLEYSVASVRDELFSSLNQKDRVRLVRDFYREEQYSFNFVLNKKLGIQGQVSHFPYLKEHLVQNVEGNYVLTPRDFSVLEANTSAILKRVDEAIDSMDGRLARNVDQLSTWFNVWIGVLGLLAIFIPLFVNLKVSRNIENIKNEMKNFETFRALLVSVSNLKRINLDYTDTKVAELKVIENLNKINYLLKKIQADSRGADFDFELLNVAIKDLVSHLSSIAYSSDTFRLLSAQILIFLSTYSSLVRDNSLGSTISYIINEFDKLVAYVNVCQSKNKLFS